MKRLLITLFIAFLFGSNAIELSAKEATISQIEIGGITFVNGYGEQPWLVDMKQTNEFSNGLKSIVGICSQQVTNINIPGEGIVNGVLYRDYSFSLCGTSYTVRLLGTEEKIIHANHTSGFGGSTQNISCDETPTYCLLQVGIAPQYLPITLVTGYNLIEYDFLADDELTQDDCSITNESECLEFINNHATLPWLKDLRWQNVIVEYINTLGNGCTSGVTNIGRSGRLVDNGVPYYEYTFNRCGVPTSLRVNGTEECVTHPRLDDGLSGAYSISCNEVFDYCTLCSDTSPRYDTVYIAAGQTHTQTYDIFCDDIVTQTCNNPCDIVITGNVINATCGQGGAINISNISSGNGSVPGPYTWIWSNGITTSGQGNLIPGSYTVTLTDSNGCTSTQTFDVEYEGLPNDYDCDNIPTNLDCNDFDPNIGSNQNDNDCDGVITSLDCNDFDPNVGSSANDNDCDGIPTSSDCNDFDPNIGSNQNDNDCDGVITSLDCNDFDPTIGGIGSGCDDENPNTTNDIYNENCVCQGTTIDPCTNSNINLTIQANDTSCGENNGTLSIIVTNGVAPYLYGVSGGGETSSFSTDEVSNTLVNRRAGIYQVNITDANGCTASGSVEILGSSGLLGVSITQKPASCGDNNGSIDIQVPFGSPGQYSYIVTTPTSTIQEGQIVSSAEIVNLTAGSYTIIVTDNTSGCQYIQNQSVSAIDGELPSLEGIPTNVTVNTDCEKEDVDEFEVIELDGRIVTFQRDETDSEVIYTWSAINSCGETTGQFIITKDYPILSEASIQNLTCENEDGSAEVIITPGNLEYTYEWNTGHTTATITNQPAGNYTVVIKLDDCIVGFDTITIFPSMFERIQEEEVSTQNPCESTISIDLSGSSNIVESVNWTHDPDYTGLVVDDLTISTVCTFEDQNGCIQLLTFTPESTVPLDLLIDDESSSNISCNGESDGSIVLDPFGGTGPFNYIWEDDISTTNIATNLGVGDYHVTVFDANGCSAEIHRELLEPNQLDVNFTTTGAECEQFDGTLTAIVSGGTTPYTFTLGSTTSEEPTFTGLEGGNTDGLMVTDGNSCVVAIETLIPCMGCKVKPNLLRGEVWEVRLNRNLDAFEVDISICSVSTGTIVYSERITIDGETLITGSTEQLSTGVYNVNVVGGNITINKRFVVSN